MHPKLYLEISGLYAICLFLWNVISKRIFYRISEVVIFYFSKTTYRIRKTLIPSTCANNGTDTKKNVFYKEDTKGYHNLDPNIAFMFFFYCVWVSVSHLTIKYTWNGLHLASFHLTSQVGPVDFNPRFRLPGRASKPIIYIQSILGT